MTENASRTRFPGIDILRGAAVAAMIVYHFAWDLRFFTLITTDIVHHPFWSGLARGIAGTFLLLSGVSLVLMARHGLDWGRYLKRLATVGGAALLVTIATFFAMPGSFIFFGILHCIALSSVLALPFLRLPVGVTMAAAAGVLILPLVFSHPVFDLPLLQWVGLGTKLPVTNDYVPVFPWFGAVLAGVGLGQLIARRQPALLMSTPSRKLALLARAGRLSLPIYLIHQPVLMALVGAIALAMPSQEADSIAQDFRQACEQSCVSAGESAPMCIRYCACSEADIRKADLWTPLIRNNLTARQQQQLSAITAQCQVQSRR
jgi:uncharacterized membrane protein